MGRSRKIPSEPVFEDGTDVPVFQTRHGTIDIFICADMRSPELSRLLVLKGARLLLQPTAYFMAGRSTREVRVEYGGKHTAQQSRVMDNGVPLVISNIGRHEYVNDSRIIGFDSQGPEPVVAGATRKEQLVVADVEIPKDARRHPANAAKRCPWLFRELAKEMKKAAGPVTR